MHKVSVYIEPLQSSIILYSPTSLHHNVMIAAAAGLLIQLTTIQYYTRWDIII